MAAAADTWTELLAADPVGEERDEYRARLAEARNARALLDLEEGKYREAEAGFRAALQLWARLVKTYPADAAYHRDRAAGINNLGLVYLRMGDAAKAARMFATMADHFGETAEQHPGEWFFPYCRAVCLLNHGDAVIQAGGPADPAAAAFARAGKILADLGAAAPDVRRQLARSYTLTGQLAQDRCRWAAAADRYEEARAVLDRLHLSYPALTDVTTDLAAAERLLAIVLTVLERGDDARRHLATATRRDEDLARLFPQNLTYRENVAADYDVRGRWEWKFGSSAGCRSALDRAGQILVAVRKANPDGDRARTLLRQVYGLRATARAQLARRDRGAGLGAVAGAAAGLHVPVVRDPDAEADWRLAVGLEAPGQPDPGVRIDRAKYRVDGGDYTGAGEDVRAAARSGQLTDHNRYDLTCLHALLGRGAASPAERDEHVLAAVSGLRALHRSQFFAEPANLDHFLGDPDYDALMSDPAFQEVRDAIRGTTP